MAKDSSGTTPSSSSKSGVSSGGGSFETGLTIKQNFTAPNQTCTVKQEVPIAEPIMKGGK